MADQWHYSVAGENKGPVSSSELKKLASAGKLSRTDLIWKDGMANWAPAGKVKGLFPAQETVSPAQMPPLPPPLRTQGGVTPPINLFTSKDAVGVPSSEASPSQRVNQKLNMTKSTLRILGAVAILVVGGAGISLINSLMKAGISNFIKPEAGLKTPSFSEQIVTLEETAPILSAGIDDEIQSFKKFIQEKINSNKGTRGVFSGSPAAYLEIMSTINDVERCLHRDVNFEQKSELKLIGRDLTFPLLGMAFDEKFQKGIASFTPEETHEYEVKQMALSEEFKSLHE